MSTFRNNKRFCIFFLVAVIAALPAQADSIPEPWQSKREEVIAVTDTACSGDESAIGEVLSRISENDPVMMNATGWLQDNCDAFKAMTKEEVRVYQRRSALAGYPIAMSNYGAALIRGDLGVAEDPSIGLALMDQSIKAGYGIAALTLAKFYAEGEWLPRDAEKARAYLRKAESENVSSEKVEEALELISEAEAEQKNTAEADQYAALVVSNLDGGFGFAHDFPEKSAAEARAQQECERRGGSNCSLKLVGRGKGCLAYRYAEDPATAYGWGISKSKISAEKRAAKECASRNDNSPCTGFAWVCNERTERPLDVLYEAAQQDPKVTSEGVNCPFNVRYSCEFPAKDLKTSFVYETHKHRKTIEVTGFESCEDVVDAGTWGSAYIIRNNETKDRIDEIGLAPQRDRIMRLLHEVEQRVLETQPGCEMSSNRFNVLRGKYLNRSTISKDPRGIFRDDGTPATLFIELPDTSF